MITTNFRSRTWIACFLSRWPSGARHRWLSSSSIISHGWMPNRGMQSWTIYEVRLQSTDGQELRQARASDALSPISKGEIPHVTPRIPPHSPSFAPNHLRSIFSTSHWQIVVRSTYCRYPRAAHGITGTYPVGMDNSSVHAPWTGQRGPARICRKYAFAQYIV